MSDLLVLDNVLQQDAAVVAPDVPVFSNTSNRILCANIWFPSVAVYRRAHNLDEGEMLQYTFYNATYTFVGHPDRIGLRIDNQTSVLTAQLKRTPLTWL